MSFSELFASGTKKNNLIHFAAIAKMAVIDGDMNEPELNLLKKFAKKLDIHAAEFEQVISDPSKFPSDVTHTKEQRLQHIFDLFQMIYIDHEIDEPEAKLIHKYAIGLGCSDERAKSIIAKSILYFGRRFEFEDYKEFLEK